ncbi:MAG: thioredoxin family protein [Desulfobacterales bacterium]|nr:thioredoxin family protein [Desulfobacterales bacterium]
MKIEILGTGCKSCDTLYANVETALNKTGLAGKSELSKTGDIDYFAKMGLFTTPGLVIDGELISSGRVLDEERIVEVLTARADSK